MNSALSTERKQIASASDATPLEQVVQKFLDFGLPRIQDPSTWLDFEQLTRLISQPSLISSTADILNQVLATKPKKPLVRARVFLSAYVICTCHNDMLQDTPADLAERIHSASKQLLDRFESRLAHKAECTDDITPSWKRYARLFEFWKVKDQQQLLESTIAHYYGLLDLKNSVGQGFTNEDSRTRREALQILDEQLRDTQAKITSLGGTVRRETMGQHQLPTPPEADCNDKEQPGICDILDRLAADNQKEQKLTSEQLAHELVVNPEFRLTRSPEESLERRVTTAAYKAFFDGLVQNMNKDSLLEVLSDLHKRLDQVIPQLEKSRVAEVMDLDLIKQQLDTNSFDLYAMTEFVLSMMAISCAPARDAAVQAIRRDTSTSTADRLCRIMDVLQDMALDLANIQLVALRPHLFSIAIQYGRAQFEKSYPPNKCDLPKTRSWLTMAKPNAVRGNSRARYNNAFAHMVTTWTEEETIPEILALDVNRIRQFQQTSLAITTVAALVMLANTFGSQGEQGSLVTRLWVLVQNNTTTVDHLCSELLRYCSISTATKEDSVFVRSMVNKTLNRQDPVFALVQRRVVAVIEHYLSHQRSMPAMKTLESYGLDCLADELESLCGLVEALADYNYRLHHENISYMLV